METTPIARELILIGGGHSHVILLRRLGMKPVPGLQVTLISPDTRTPYSGMLPGMVAGHYTEDEIHIDLLPLVRFAGARFIQARVLSVDPEARTVRCAGRPDLRYDIVSIDIGITPALDVPGAGGRVIAVKPIDELLEKWQGFVQRVSQGRVSTVGFVGAGAGGVELALAVHHRVSKMGAGPIGWHLVSDGDDILPGYPGRVRERFRAICAARGIEVHNGFRVASVADGRLVSETGAQIAVDETFWVTSAAPQPWLRDTGLRLDDQGYIAVGPTLQSVSHPHVFAVGDTASMVDDPRPKAGVYAVRQGPPLDRNIRRLLQDLPPRPFHPQQEFLSLVSTGDRSAVASRNGRSLSGPWVWRWKDWIDRRFMARFSDLPTMRAPARKGLAAEFDEQMQCGGCGSKVSAELLAQVLDEFGPPSRDDAAEFRVPPGRIMLHTVDYFRNFVSDPYVFARIGVTHALSDIYAMGGDAATALAIITVPYGKPPVTRSLLRQLIAGTRDQLAEDGVQLVGGHTSEGVELAIGFAVNGTVEEARIIRKAGMAPGQALILTKALGTGALFAADMQHRARGRWIARAEEMMQRSNREAMDILKHHHVLAATDVTGFGLAGHLQEMIDASGCGAEIDLDTLPVLEGAGAVINQMRITSTLHESNRSAAAGVEPVPHPAFELLFDPQTAGGLLAAVPASQVDLCVAALRAAGYADACRIGEVIASPMLTLRHQA